MLDVKTYYDHTRFDYRLIWGSRKNLAVHFGFYDEHADKHHHAVNNTNRAMADLAGVQAGEQVLDAGCGMGSACFWLAEHRQAHATGISIVESQIADCLRARDKRPAAQVEFLTADYCHTPFPDATFDVVWACESVCHTPNKIDFYREAFRVLKPGGRLVMAEYLRMARPTTETGEILLEKWLRPWAIPDIDTSEEHKKHALEAGFSAIEIRDVTPNVRVSLRNLHELCTKWLPYGKIMHAMRIVNDIRLNNVRASIAQFEALNEGAWFYGMALAHKASE
ncbi:MAG: methyltransferase domain-containing protein [Bacteroidota bacterium]